MRCATHPETEAFAICRGCFRGVCSSCAVPTTGKSVACSAECVAEAAKINRLVAVSGRSTLAVHRTQAVMFLVIALFTGIGAIVATGIGRWFMGGATALLLLGAYRFFRLAAPWRKLQKEQAPTRRE